MPIIMSQRFFGQTTAYVHTNIQNKIPAREAGLQNPGFLFLKSPD